MEKRKIGYAIVIVVLLGVLGFLVYHTFGAKQSSVIPGTENLPPVSISPSDNSSATPVAPSMGQQYENEYMKIVVPEGWQLTEATQVLQQKTYNTITGKEIPVGTPVATKTGAVNIIKGQYILYIHPNAVQASGAPGGRFAEIVSGAPSGDAVILEKPTPPCMEPESTFAFMDRTRKDLYVDTAHKPAWCAAPASGKTVWYFSYISDIDEGYFNYYQAGEPTAYVITMAYNSKDVNSLPVKGSVELTTALNEMTDILKTLQLKKLAP